MRVGVPDWRLPVRGAEAVRLAAAVGADGVALDLGGPGRGPDAGEPARVARVREECARAGVRPLALAANRLNDIGITAHPSSADGTRVRRVVEHLLDTAVAVGVPLVLVPSFRRSAIVGVPQRRRTAALLARAVPEAAARGLVLAHENVLPAGDALLLAEETGCSALRFQLDTYNPVAAGLDTPALVGALAGWWAEQVHLKDGPPATGDTPRLGRGSAGVTETMTALSASPGTRIRAVIVEGDYRLRSDEKKLRADLVFARNVRSQLGA